MKALITIAVFIHLAGISLGQAPAPTPQLNSAPDSAAVAKEEAEAEEEFKKRLDVAKKAALDMYPDIANPNSPVAKECERLIEMLKKENDPILASPLSPMFIVALAASNVGATRVFTDDKEAGNKPEVGAAEAK